MHRQLHIFLTAVMFYTRIPCPAWVGHSAEYLNKATIYFPVIGWIVGGIAALVYYGASFVFPTSIALFLSMGASVLTTGAFHEDGLADVCDGFGGGWTKEKILDIMKDSRVGTYGVVGLLLVLLLKFLALQALVGEKLIPVLIIGHALSRFTALTFIFTHSYVRENDDSKAKPVAKALQWHELGIAMLFALLPLWLLPTPWTFTVLIPLLLLKQYLGYYFTKWIGGYTGDCLGATQQLAEVVVYLFFVAAPWKYF